MSPHRFDKAGTTSAYDPTGDLTKGFGWCYACGGRPWNPLHWFAGWSWKYWRRSKWFDSKP